jgi:TRAP transporter TAXI family solute receptor
MNNRSFRFFLGALALLCAAACEKPPRRLTELRLATGGATGTYYAYGTALAGILEKRLKLPVRVRETAASVANIALIERGAADFAFVQNDVMTYAYNGVNLFSAEGAKKNIAAVAGLYREVCHLVSGGDIAETAGLKGKRVSIGEEGSGTALNAEQIFEVFGINLSDISRVNLGFGDSARELRSGGIDAFFCTAGTPTPAIAELAAERKISLLPIGDARARLLISHYPYYTPYTVPAGTYAGITEDVQTAAVRAALITGTEVADDDVYALVKALFESASDSAAHPKAAELKPESAVEGIPIPFHPGALRYYREQGIIK